LARGKLKYLTTTRGKSKMRKLTVVSVISIFYMIAISAIASESSHSATREEQTLISGDIESGGFGGPVLKVTEFGDDVGLLVGGRGGWIINHAFVIGGGGYGLTTNIDAPVFDHYLNVGYGGGIVEYIVLSDRLIHLSVNTLIGAGGVNYRDRDWDDWDWENNWYDEADEFFVAEPGVDLMLNVSKIFRVGVGVSYRYVNGIDIRGLSDSDMSGLSATFTLKFGKF
jgi:hypothetical protein